MQASTIQIIGAVIFGIALLHTFSATLFEKLSKKIPRHAGLFHLLGEVEVVFGFWAFVLIVFMAISEGGAKAVAYAESRQFVEPLFVFVVMVIAASRPVLSLVRGLLVATARLLPMNDAVVLCWLGLAILPLLGSLITEPAAMTLAALTLAPLVFHTPIPAKLKYAALGVLFVNISIGGALTSYAAPPVLMVAKTWQWDSLFMFQTFGWRVIIAVMINASVLTMLLAPHLRKVSIESDDQPVPLLVSAIHLLFLAMVVLFAHHPVLFIGLFLFFLGYTQAYYRHQSPLILKESLLVGFFLAGLVVLGGMQQWWLQPIISTLPPLALFFGALGLTAITDNAALTYLGSLITGMSDEAKYMLVAGAIGGGGLTVIANAPNPAGAALLKTGFPNHSINALWLLLGASLPTVMAAIMFLL
ncbi:putative Na+/H+ antiporter [Massilia sp. W12]|uniref:putative Na+/H+ antiporter n=1 Tax=Massilia sp. W12 TaxID=3126507 RepID=UPI0030D5BD07